VLAGGGRFSRQQTAGPGFESASIRPANSPLPRQALPPVSPNGQVVLTNQTLRQLVGFAFHIPEYQIAGGPDWANSQTYNVTARMAAAKETNIVRVDRARAMMQKLLADRFALRVHTEPRSVKVYLLTRGNGQAHPMLQPTKIDCGPEKPLPCGRVAVARRGAMFARAAPMEAIARMALSPAVNGIVLDRTGLIGNFDVDLEWRPLDTTAPLRNSRPNQVPTIFEAVEQQLGLKLELAQTSLEFLIIDRAEAITDK